MKPVALALVLNAVLTPSYASEGQFTLNNIIELAVARDQGLIQLNSQALSLKETGVASATLMDPKVKFGVGGLPVDSFKFDEDAMTNISVGLSQQFSRGATLDLSKKQYEQQAQVISYQAELRKLDIARGITQLWIELKYLIRAKELTEEIRGLMLEMSQFIETNYSLGKSETQDLLYAELQVSQLDEKLQKNRQMQQRIRAQLSEWVEPKYVQEAKLDASLESHWQSLLDIDKVTDSNSTEYFDLLVSHPRVKAAEQNIQSKETQVSIAEQSYTPQFGVEVAYAYRQANGMDGQPASDLVSAYLTMDIPLFTNKKQDRKYAAAQHQVGAAKSQKDLLLVQMNARVNTLISDKHNLEERIQRYQKVLVKQAKERTQATERGYENNTAPFGELITAARDELMIAKEQARLMADLNSTQNELAYVLNQYDQNIIELSAAYELEENN
ncbi:TolC family protein [Vibrio hannami]|uniref:TolC family protein n=1 Tax=Vibrio hannami TaxID=2717094 RepID=UPI00240FAA5F|nr:TolC family protein [Vibrio hannami]MDG3084978.1 TolC family protein [Vibrio hannami]